MTQATLTIDLATLQDNYRMLKALVAPAQCSSVVKSNAYGIGLAPAARALWAAGCRTFFVALPQEGYSLRKALPEATIYSLNGLLRGAAPDYAARALRPVLGSPEEIEDWAGFCREHGRSWPAAIHIDSGINRLGLSAEQVAWLVENRAVFESFKPSLVMSHLACAGEADHPMNRAQREAFDRLRAFLPTLPVSLANSSAIFNGTAYHYDLVRPGIALYGGNPRVGRANPMKSVVALHATVLQTRDVPKGQTVGYDATWQAPRDSRIAVLGVGYGDGYLRGLGSQGQGHQGKAKAYVAGRSVPVVGRISMDMLTIDVTELPVGAVRRGAEVELIGKHVTIDSLAQRAGTIAYELLTNLGARYRRIYCGAGT
ncbi:MAG: alanine racemase [Hyphomicrobiales bacterium]